MPTEYAEFYYNYMTATLSFTDWLVGKDNEGWELVTLARDYSNLADRHILFCIFKRRT